MMDVTLPFAPFRKMRLVPADEPAQVRQILEKRVRHYDPVVSAMADLLPAIDKPKVRRGNHASALAIHNVNLHRYKSLQRQRDGVQSTTSGSERHTPDVTLPPPPLPDVYVPTIYKAKLAKLLRHLDENPEVIGKTDADEIVIDGTVLRGTSFSGAIRSLYVNSSLPPPGTRQLVNRLRTLGVPENVMSSKVAHTFYGQSGEGIKWPGKPGRVLRIYK